jgi:protein-S-isoprenylcysteine O-methyltransferase Ste14
MRRFVVSSYHVFSYLVLFAVILYATCFVGNLGLSQSIDAKPQMPLVPALLIDGSLLFLAALLKSARTSPGFKRYWNRCIPSTFERATNIFLNSILAAFIFWQWQPIGRVVWEISNVTAGTIFLVIYFVGWAIMLIGVLLNQQADPLRLRQSWLNFHNKPFTTNQRRLFFLHKLVRHPVNLGLLICFWSAPTMTVSHLFFAMLMTLYIFTVFQLEEKNLPINYRDKFPESIRRR